MTSSMPICMRSSKASPAVESMTFPPRWVSYTKGSTHFSRWSRPIVQPATMATNIPAIT